MNIPAEMMARVQRAAVAEQLSPEALVLEAVEPHLRRKRLPELYAYGEGQATKAGAEKRDVDDIVKAGRRELANRGR